MERGRPGAVGVHIGRAPVPVPEVEERSFTIFIDDKLLVGALPQVSDPGTVRQSRHLGDLAEYMCSYIRRAARERSGQCGGGRTIQAC